MMVNDAKPWQTQKNNAPPSGAYPNSAHMNKLSEMPKPAIRELRWKIRW